MEEILNLLKDNARLTAEDIAAMTKKTPAEVKAIIKKFEDDGVILKYSAIVNPEKDLETKEKVCEEITTCMNEFGQPTDRNPEWIPMIADYQFSDENNLQLKSFGSCFIEFLNNINLISSIDEP